MARRDQLRREGERFALEVSNLLNGTVCDGVRLKTLIERDSVLVGYKLGKTTLVSPEAIPVALGRRSPKVYINVDYKLDLDPDGGYLRVLDSVMALSLDKDREQTLLHYDYQRGKTDYAEAHLQVCADSPHWSELCRLLDEQDPARDCHALERLHLPVGGRRYRPTLEDLIQFMIDEKIVVDDDVRPGAGQTISDSRDRFTRSQLRAAVRRDPESALEILVDMGLATRVSPTSKKR